MIIILSYDMYEQGTDPVIDWLIHYKADFIKITMKDFFNPGGECCIDVNRGRLLIKGVDVTDRVNVIFYRRLLEGFKLTNQSIFSDQIEEEVTNESHALINFMMTIFKKKVWLPAPHVYTVNKLSMVLQAQAFGLNPPHSIVTNSKHELLKFLKTCGGKIITKPINKSGYYIVDRKTYFSHVNTISKKDVLNYPESFFASLFQEQVIRDIEIRSFYLDGEFYSTALMISGKPQGVDIKKNFHYEYAHWVRYELPKEVQQRIHAFMKSIGLNTGSMDIIQEKNGNYRFLEVNPVGQYGATSHVANYKLEKKIAEWLIKNDCIKDEKNSINIQRQGA